jgi:hypothetical protein
MRERMKSVAKEKERLVDVVGSVMLKEPESWTYRSNCSSPRVVNLVEQGVLRLHDQVVPS